MSKKSIWEDSDCTGPNEIALRKSFYGYSAGVGSNLADDCNTSVFDNIKDQINSSGVYEDCLSGSVYIPVGYPKESSMLTHDNYSKEALAYLQDGLEALLPELD